MSEPLRVVVVDDHPLWVRALARDLGEAGIEVAGTAGDAASGAELVRSASYDVAVLDLRLPGGSGIELTTVVRARAAGPDDGPHVVILSASGEEADVLDALRAGARGYLVKSAPVDELLASIAAAARGAAVFTPSLAALVMGEFHRMAQTPADGPQLSERERAVLGLVARGFSARAIGEQLYLSHRTVENHTQSVLRKLEVHSRTEAANWHWRHGGA